MLRGTSEVRSPPLFVTVKLETERELFSDARLLVSADRTSAPLADVYSSNIELSEVEAA